MKKKKTKLVLPGGIQGLVHDVQQKSSKVGLNNTTQEKIAGDNEIQDKKNIESKNEKTYNLNRVGEHSSVSSIDAKTVETPVYFKDGSEDIKKDKEYSIVKDQSKDNWDLFLNLARDYKNKQSKLSTVYIDDSLKDILDRLRTAEGIKLPSSAILSSIVARFIYDHEGKIKQVLFGDHKLL
jgi:hypothetical protein